MPEEVSGIESCSTFNSDIYLAAWDNKSTPDPRDDEIVDLDCFWDPGGFDIVYNFDPSLIEAVSVTIDPDGWFASFWPNGIFIVKQEIDNLIGIIWLAFLGIPGDGPTWTPVSGQGTIARITFHSIYDSGAFPPPSRTLGLRPTTIAGMPKPYPPWPPWGGSPEVSPPLPHFVQNATYTAPFKPHYRRGTSPISIPP